MKTTARDPLPVIVRLRAAAAAVAAAAFFAVPAAAQEAAAVAPAPPPPATPAPAVDPAAVPDFGEATFDGIAFVKIPAGTFTRGTTDAQRDALRAAGLWSALDAVEQPARTIRISRPFFLGKYEVTQAQWKRVMGDDRRAEPSAFKGVPELPVESVTLSDIETFLGKLKSASPDKTARYRLPSEAEWEYACRAGSAEAFGMGADKTPITVATLPESAWFTVNADNKTHPVGTRKPNAWGLHDMHGNVWEWCRDGYAPTFYALSPDVDPVYEGPATERILRGGSWFLDARAQRAALRGGILPTAKSQYVGFRLVREL